MSIERLKSITVEEGKCGGRPCIRGQRIRVTDVLELLANGASFEEVLADYSFLEREDIFAAMEYAASSRSHSPPGIVKFLVDNQLPAALARFLTSRGAECDHVLDLDMADASDAESAKTRIFYIFANAPSSRMRFVWIRFGELPDEGALGRNRACMAESGNWPKRW